MTLQQWAIVNFIHKGPWWKNHGEHVTRLFGLKFDDLATSHPEGILVLNIYLLLPILTATMNGLDATLVNGLQILPAWQEYIHDPSGKTLGAFHVFLIAYPASPSVADTQPCSRVN
jgi:hypothetical protein